MKQVIAYQFPTMHALLVSARSIRIYGQSYYAKCMDFIFFLAKYSDPMMDLNP